MTTRTDTRNALHEYHAVLVACLVVAVVMLVYWQSFSRMIGMWSLGSYQHGWLVYPISLFVLWLKRHALATAGLQASWAGVVLTAIVVIVWIVARTVSVQAVEFVTATLLICTAFWAVAGTRAVHKAVFPLALLLAAVPIGEFLVTYLMESTADIATVLLHLAGVPAYRDGMFLTLPGGSFEVAKVCSGLRFLLAGIMASLAYSYVTYVGFAKRAAFVAISAVILVIANGVRAFIVMYVASATEMRVFTGEDHVTFGLFLFTAVFFALVFVGERFSDPAATVVDNRDVAPVAGHAGIYGAAVAATLLALAAGPTFEHVKAQQPVPVAERARLPELPGCMSHGEAWQGDLSPSDWSPDYGAADYHLRGSFVCGGNRTSVYVATYLRQQQGKELINSTNRLWPHEWRRYVDESVISFALNGDSVDVRQVIVRAPERWMLIWYWYQMGDLVTGNKIEVKLQEAIHAFSLRPMESSVVAIGVTVPRGTDMPALRDDLEPLANAVMSWNLIRAD